MGLAVINRETCLAHTGKQECRLCVEECQAAGYHAIEMRPIELELGDIPEGIFSDMELEAMRSIAAPFVDTDACTGCGLCEYRCHTAYTQQEPMLAETAIRIVPKDRARNKFPNLGSKWMIDLVETIEWNRKRSCSTLRIPRLRSSRRCRAIGRQIGKLFRAWS